jgi:hypothetical protein
MGAQVLVPRNRPAHSVCGDGTSCSIGKVDEKRERGHQLAVLGEMRLQRRVENAARSSRSSGWRDPLNTSNASGASRR